MAYSYKSKYQNHAKALANRVNASYKDLGAVCSNIKGMSVILALEFLAQVIKKKKAVYFKKHFKKKAHRSSIGGKIGGFPVKSAKIVLKLLNSALKNAEKKGFMPEAMFVEHACANKVSSYPRISPRGKRMRSDVETARVELIIAESEDLKKFIDDTKKQIEEQVKKAKPEAKAKPKEEPKQEPKPETKAKPKEEPKQEPKPEAKAKPKEESKAKVKKEEKKKQAKPKPKPKQEKPEKTNKKVE